jgi:hypothetical protein
MIKQTLATGACAGICHVFEIISDWMLETCTAVRLTAAERIPAPITRNLT